MNNDAKKTNINMKQNESEILSVLSSDVKRNPTMDKKIDIDMYHYKPNRSSFWLILLTIALNIAMFIIIYKTNTSALAADLQLGFDLIINVVFMLTCFLAAEKTKRYSKEWGITSIVLGGVEAARIFWIPLYYYLNGGISVGSFIACIVLLAGAGAALIAAGLIAIAKYKIIEENAPMLDGYLAKKGKPVAIKVKPTKVKKATFSNFEYKKKVAIEEGYDEFEVTYVYKKYIIHYYMFFLKQEHATIEDAKKEINRVMKSGRLLRYTWAYMMKCGSAIDRYYVKGVKK